MHTDPAVLAVLLVQASANGWFAAHEVHRWIARRRRAHAAARSVVTP